MLDVVVNIKVLVFRKESNKEKMANFGGILKRCCTFSEAIFLFSTLSGLSGIFVISLP